MTYYITFHVDAHYVAEVDAVNVEEAKMLARHLEALT